MTESYEIKVSAGNGSVPLAGAIGSWAEKQIAERVAFFNITPIVRGPSLYPNDGSFDVNTPYDQFSLSVSVEHVDPPREEHRPDRIGEIDLLSC